MINMSQTCKRIIKADLALSLFFYGIGAIFITVFESYFQINFLYYTIGMIFGVVLSVLKIMLLEKTINKAVDMPDEDATNYVRLHYTLRYFLTGAAVVVAAITPWISLFSVVLALVALRPAVYVAGKLEAKAESN